jgi:hypothetical protein
MDILFLYFLVGVLENKLEFLLVFKNKINRGFSFDFTRKFVMKPLST